MKIIFIIGDLPDLYSNDFEEDIDGWTVGLLTDSATAGIWELAEPIATYNDGGLQVQPGEDNTVHGTYCFLTSNGIGDGDASAGDVDDGNTTLLSPVFNFSNIDDIVLTYFRWYTNSIGDNANNDVWNVSISSNGGTSWTSLENTSSSGTSWEKKRFILSNYIDFTDAMQFRFIAEDILYDGDAGSGGSLVEAALDDFLIEYISSGTNILGDVNNDESVNVLDVVLVVNMILGSESMNFSTADINFDGEINVQDIISLINIVLSQE